MKKKTLGKAYNYLFEAVVIKFPNSEQSYLCLFIMSNQNQNKTDHPLPDTNILPWQLTALYFDPTLPEIGTI